MKALEIITLNMPERYEDLPTEEEQVKAYLVARSNNDAIDSLVRTKFKKVLKTATPWSDDNIPTSETEDVLRMGDLTFRFTTKPTTKRRPYGEIISKLRHYLNTIDREHSQGVRRPCVLTFDGTPHILARHLLETKTAWKDEVKKKGISQGMTIDGKEGIVLPETLAIPARDYGSLENPENGRIYVVSDMFGIEGLKRAFNPLENDIHTRIGYDKDNLPETTRVDYVQMGSTVFVVHNILTSAPSLGKVVASLIKEGKTPRGSSTLVNIANRADVDTGTYRPRISDGKAYVLVDAMRENLDALIEKNTTQKLNQTIEPVQWYAD